MTTERTLEQAIADLPPRRRRKIAARAKALIAEEQSLQDLRKALRLTQATMARRLRIGQDSVSRIEQRSDVLISTLRGYLAAFGADLAIVAEFPDRPPIRLTGLGGLSSGSGKRGRRHVA